MAMVKFRFLEDIVISDVAFEAYGRDLPELFANAALALTSTMVEVDGVEPRVERKVELEHEGLDQLLFDFLDELVFLKDTENLLFVKYRIQLKQNGLNLLTARLYGDKIDPARHTLGRDVKAITYHEFQVRKTRDGWVARVVADI